MLKPSERNTITLKGSTKIVTDFFAFAVNSILFQRGIYPPESFKQQKQYGIGVMVTTDDGLVKYLTTVLQQMSEWLVSGGLRRLVLVISSTQNKAACERWTFEVHAQTGKENSEPAAEKPQKEITSEIQAIIRQITASITFLPLLTDPCTFDLLVYTASDASVPTEWEDSDPRYISKSADVKLRSFTTKVHKIDTLVSYRDADD